MAISLCKCCCKSLLYAGRVLSVNYHYPVLPACLLIIVTGLLWPPTVHADKIYKWVDEYGQVHYGARPPAADVSVEQVELSPSQSQNPEPDPDLRDRYERRDRLLEQFAEEREADRKAKAEAEAAEKKRQQECEQARKTLQIYRDSRYLYDETATGEPRILTDSERAIEEDKAAAARDKLCR
ncbi:MAG: DUF4124 domain-containing protein [Gammaproteobacteria bacterium]